MFGAISRRRYIPIYTDNAVIIVHILDGNSEKGAHACQEHICYLVCFRHFITSNQSHNFFL